MSETKHSPEPWVVVMEDDGRVGGIVSDEKIGPQSIAPEEPGEWETAEWTDPERAYWRRCIVETDSGYYPPRPADARRIVACVNALAGIPTEDLEALRPGDIALALGVLALGQLNAVMRGEEP